MNKKNTIFSLLSLVIIISAVILIALYKPKREEAVEVEVLDSVITFISGEASITSGSSVKTAEIGDRPVSGDIIKTEVDSYLEMLVDNSAVIRVQGDTQLALDSLSLIEGEADISFSLLKGSVINKVEKIIGRESFSIRTSTAAFGVRGTEFLVTSGTEGALLAVKSGSIHILPYPDALGRLKEKIPESDEVLSEYLQKVEEGFPSVAGGSEIVFRKDQADSILASFAEVEKAIDGKKAGTITDEALSNIILNSGGFIAAEAEKTATEIKPVSAENIEILKITDSMKIQSVEDTRKEVLLKTDPEGARIFFDDVFIGYSSVSALLDEKRVIRLLVEKEGYASFEKEMAVSEITEKPYIIKLEEAEPDKGFVEISAIPSDAEIFIGPDGPFKSTYRGSFDPGTKISVSVRKKEYMPESFEISIVKGVTEKRRASLDLLLVPYTYDTGFQRTDSVVSAGPLYYAFTGDTGLFSVISPDGKSVFRSSEPALSPPVFAGGKLAYVAGNSLKAIETEGWNAAGGIELEEALYRRPVVSDERIFINSGDSVLRIDSARFETERRIKVPDRIVSTPAVYGEQLLTVTDKGVLQIFGSGDTPLSSIPVSMGNPGGMSSAVSGDTGYFAGIRGVITAVDLKTGSMLWTGGFTPSRPLQAGASVPLPEIIASDKGAAVLSGGNLKFFRADGSEAGEIAGINAFCPGDNNLIYAALASGTGITAFNPETGAPVKEAVTGFAVTGLVYRDGKIHASAVNGKYAVINPGAIK